MKKILITALSILCLLSVTSTAKAITVVGNVTADNAVWVYSGTGTTWNKTGANWSEWSDADILNLNVNPGQEYDLYFAVQNVYLDTPPWNERNPAGFLGSLFTPSGYFAQSGTNTLSTSAGIEILPYAAGWAGDPTIDVTTLSGWQPAVALGANNNPATVWYQGNGNAPITGIENDAQWVWTDSNINWDTMDKFVIIHAPFSVVPEPASMSLLGLGLLGLIGLRKKREA